MTHDFRIQVASDPDRDDVVVELLVDGEVLAAVRETETGSLAIHLYAAPGKGWDLDLAEFEEWLGRARDRFRALGPKRQ
jgi:predicted methyltransferase MtxX (methanogen marker protein 4)